MTGSVFSSYNIVFRYLKKSLKGFLQKQTNKQTNTYLYLFSQCFGSSLSCVQIKSSDYCDDASAKLKYLNSYEYIFNPALFIINLEGRHFGSRESIPISHQNSQTSKEIVVDTHFF